MPNVYYVDGAFVTADDAQIPVTDLAILRGYGIFDFMRTYHGQPFHLDSHLDRLYRSADAISLHMPWSRDEVKEIVLQTLARNDHAESTEFNVRIIVTGGDSPDFITPGHDPRLIVLVTPSHPPADHYYINGAKIITVSESRYLPNAKSLNYIPAIRALRIAREKDAIEAIYVNPTSHALEGTTTNLFAFFGDTLVTPEDDAILPGITRGVVLELATGHYPINIRDLHVTDLYSADEVFITASNKQVMPVVQVDDRRIGDGKPGRRTRHLMTLFGELTGIPLPV